LRPRKTRFAPTRPPESGRIRATLTRKGEPYGESQLITQYQNILEYLDSEEINPTLRVKRSATSDESRAYPKRALMELLVNLLVHRDYAAEEFSSIDAVSGERLTFRNAGGVPEPLRRVAPRRIRSGAAPNPRPVSTEGSFGTAVCYDPEIFEEPDGD